MNNSIVNISFRYLESDFVRATRAHIAVRMRIWLDIIAVVLGLVVAVYLWPSADWHWLSITLLSIFGIFGLFLAAAFTVIPMMVFRRELKVRDEYVLTFSQDGIHFKTAHIDSHLQWSLYSWALIDSYSYVLYYGVRSFTVIPKRVFQSVEQQTAFAQLLTENVSKIVRKR